MQLNTPLDSRTPDSCVWINLVQHYNTSHKVYDIILECSIPRNIAVDIRLLEDVHPKPSVEVHVPESENEETLRETDTWDRLIWDFFAYSLCRAQDSSMIRYFERRILGLEDRLYKCEQDIQQYVYEFKELSHKLISRLEDLSRYKTDVKDEMENLLARLERAEWDIDYLETTSTTSSNTCVEVDDQLVEKQFRENAEEKRVLLQKLNTSCTNMLAHIKSHKTVRRDSSTVGSWMRNAGHDSETIYFFSGASSNVLLEFTNMDDFTNKDKLLKEKNLSLPYFWKGTGHVVYNSILFFHRYGTLNEIVKYDQEDNVTQTMDLHGAGQIPPYQLSPFTLIDLAVDEHGLWAIHGDPSNGGNIVLTKVDYKKMVVDHTWNTSCDSNNAEAAFIICGTLYVVYNNPAGGRSHIDCIYDTFDLIAVHETPTLYFPRRYSSHTSLKYNPVDQTLYAWDEGYQILYKFDTKAKFESP
ncbi:olfactomedin-like protein 1 [Rhinophrynus dorsalis]